MFSRSRARVGSVWFAAMSAPLVVAVCLLIVGFGLILTGVPHRSALLIGGGTAAVLAAAAVGVGWAVRQRQRQ